MVKKKITHAYIYLPGECIHQMFACAKKVVCHSPFNVEPTKTPTCTYRSLSSTTPVVTSKTPPVTKTLNASASWF